MIKPKGVFIFKSMKSVVRKTSNDFHNILSVTAALKPKIPKAAVKNTRSYSARPFASDAVADIGLN